jgi:predicted nucleic acid-binding protein
MMRVLYDVNVLLDVLANREPFADESSTALSLAETGEVEGVIAAHTVTTLHYLLERELGQARSRRALTALLSFLEVEAVDGDRIRHALGMAWPDFEDAVQAACAESSKANCLVTRDMKGFKKSAVRPISPAELVALQGR